jgi:hypothetical protein
MISICFNQVLDIVTRRFYVLFDYLKADDTVEASTILQMVIMRSKRVEKGKRMTRAAFFNFDRFN